MHKTVNKVGDSYRFFVTENGSVNEITLSHRVYEEIEMKRVKNRTLISFIKNISKIWWNGTIPLTNLFLATIILQQSLIFLACEK